MRKTVLRTIFALAVIFVLFSAFDIVSLASSNSSVPNITREYIQQKYSNDPVNKDHRAFYSVIITVAVFAAAAIAIPTVFFVIDKIRSKNLKNHTKKTYAKRDKS